MTKRLALLAALLLAPHTALADEDVPARPERLESAEKPPRRIRSSLVLGGLGFTAGFWALNAGSSYMFPDQPGFDRLRMPVIGPWQALASNDCNGSCGFINYFNYVYFTLSGLAQAGGLGLVIEALVTPTADPNAPRRPVPAAPPGPRAPEAAPPGEPPPAGAPSPGPAGPSKPLFFLPMPSPVGQSGVGLSFGGLF